MDSNPASIKLPFGLQGDRLVPISEVPSGLACRCRCPGCGRPLVARKGPIRRPYFAHHRHPGSISCLETMLHQLAKEVLAEEQHLLLPGLKVRENLPAAEADGLFLQPLVKTDKLPARPVDIHEVRLEMRTGNIRPDVIVITPAGELVAVEVAVTHKADDLKRRRLQELGLAAVEFDLSRLSRELTKEAVRQALFGPATAVQWLYHPQEAQLRQRVQQELQQQRQQDRQNQLRERQERQRLQAQIRARRQASGSRIWHPGAAPGNAKEASWWAHNLSGEDFFAAFNRWPNQQESYDLAVRVDEGTWQPVSQKYRWARKYFPSRSRPQSATVTGDAYRLKKYGEL